MKLCQTCGQHLAEAITACPVCGSRVAKGREQIDDFRILKVLQEGHASILCKAVSGDQEQPVMIRLFTPDSGVDDKIAERLQQELADIRALPQDMFIVHHQVNRSSDGLWYRVSEWVDTENWGDLMASGRLSDCSVTFKLFHRIAKALDILHKGGQFIPHLILDDIMVIAGKNDNLSAKIDYKLSRFIDPNLDRPGPQLKHLLDCHPDFVHQRPLDHRSDIWSLGRIFVQILSADFEPRDLHSRIEKLLLPDSIKTLFRTMLADDPNLRPQSMTEVANILAKKAQKEIASAKKIHRLKNLISFPEILHLNLRLRLVLTGVVLFLLTGTLATWYLGYFRHDSQTVLREYANSYAGSVAFVLVEYTLRHGDKTVYRNRTEGTAFLVSKDGYLLTNRHVACPWLEDNTLQRVIQNARINKVELSFNQRMFLWFDGERAFSRLPELDNYPEVIDVYSLSSAYSSHSTPGVVISGVARASMKTRYRLHSPLSHDFAVLKIDQVPDGVIPIPLDLNMEASKVVKLSPVITMGFPLGSRTQTTHVNVSVTHGHVRRSFEDFLQVDTSIYSGNSGGPIIDTRGKVIGIASAVAMQRAQGRIPVYTALSDIGMVLPITKAAAFLQDLRQGRDKWNGILDLSLEKSLKEILGLAREGDWQAAKKIADDKLKKSLHPSLVMTAGVINVCARQYKDARHRFKQSLSINNDHNLARLMLYILEWRSGTGKNSEFQDSLQHLDWRSEDEFMGYLISVFEDRVNEATALSAWESASEKSWLTYAVALKHAQRRDWEGAQSLLYQTILDGEMDDWPYFLARAELDRIQQRLRFNIPATSKTDHHQSQINAFKSREMELRKQKESRQSKIQPLIVSLSNRDASITEKREALGKILTLAPANRKLLVNLAVLSAMEDDWESSMTYINHFLQKPGRESANRLKSGLLKAELLGLAGKQEAARSSLKTFYHRTQDFWYRTIAECLLGKKTQEDLKDYIDEHPEYLITGYTAFGLWAESEGENEKAVKYYKEALGSYLDYWVEYDLARERIRRLRK